MLSAQNGTVFKRVDMISVKHLSLRLAVLALSPALALGACSTPRPLEGNAVVDVVEGTSLPAPTRADMGGSGRDFALGPYDKLRIFVLGIEELEGFEAQIDGAGRISFPLAGDIIAAGKTPAELGSEIEDRMRENFVRNPQVSVNLEETNSQIVFVSGEVNEPGGYPVPGDLTLLGAVSQAKGLTEFAKKEYVVVFRTVDGTDMAALYDLEAIQLGLYQDPTIYANDRVVVSTSRARRLFRDILSGAPLLTTPIIAAVTSGNSN